MLTIIIPTMNRSDFLIRLLQYYKKTNYQYQILIGDSSNSEHVNKTKKALIQLKETLKISYHEYPNLTDIECTQRLFELVSTPYAVLIADDDFLVPNGLNECINFLEEHNDYIAAHGVGICFKLQSEGAYGNFLGITKYILPSVEEEKASQRLTNHLRNYSVTLFCVHRTKEYREMYRENHIKKDRRFSTELLPCCLSVVQGKMIQLDCLYLIRQDHNRRYLLPNVEEWIQNPNWSSSYNLFRDRLAAELHKRENLPINTATNIVERAFQYYLHTYNNRFIRLQSFLSRFPGLGFIFSSIKYYFSSNTGQFSLAKILNPSSAYNKDFMPIYTIVTTQPEKGDK
jgi:glycosyltransferase domain-containing protein